MEHLSHCLCWTKTTNEGAFNVDLVELPRLKLSFAAKFDDMVNRGFPLNDTYENRDKSAFTASIMPECSSAIHAMCYLTISCVEFLPHCCLPMTEEKVAYWFPTSSPFVLWSLHALSVRSSYWCERISRGTRLIWMSPRETLGLRH